MKVDRIAPLAPRFPRDWHTEAEAPVESPTRRGKAYSRRPGSRVFCTNQSIRGGPALCPGVWAKSMALIGAGALILALASSTFAADQWSRFRGPNGSGVSEDAMPVKWTDKDYAWNIELPGVGHSSPVIWGDKVFVTSADEDEGQRLLLCLNASDGAIQWKHDVELKPYKKHGENSYASSTPAVDDKHVYVEWTTQEEFTVLAVTHEGKEAWRANLGAYKTQHGGGGSPVVIGDVVIVNVDHDKPGSFIAGLDRNTGKEIWRTPRESTRFSTSTPCIHRTPAGQEQLVFTTHANGFTAIDPATGHVLWELPDVFGNRVVSSPVAANGLLFGTCGEGARGDFVVAVQPPDEKGSVPKIAYKLTQEMPYVPTPIVYRDRLFTWSDSGTIACHDAATGEKIWQEKVRGGFFGSPICAGGKLYCISKRGEVFVVDAGDEFKLLSRNPLNEASDATPAVANGRMYLRTVSHLVCIDGSNKPDRTAEVGGVEP